MTLNLHLPMKSEVLKPTITVIGVGGAGGNAVNNMITSQLEGVNFVVANTDAQALDHSLAERTIQLGAGITKGLGAGANPDVGRMAAEEVADEIASHIEGSNMVFITAGMGGGTGTGAAPAVARIAREQGILTVAVVTKPFQFEGTHRMKLAENGLKELQEYVDTLIIIPNQNLFRIANDRTTFADAFKLADEVLHSGVRGVTDLMVKPGLINLDFADIRTVMREMGKAMMGTGDATGEKRAIEAAEAAISNPLLDDVSLKGARALLINITGGPDMTLFEVDEAANRIRQEVDPEANIIFGSAFNDSMEGRMRVSVVATGIDAQPHVSQQRPAAAVANEPKKPYVYSGLSARAPMQQGAPAFANPAAALDSALLRPRNIYDAPRREPAFATGQAEAIKPAADAALAAEAREETPAEPAAPPPQPARAEAGAPSLSVSPRREAHDHTASSAEEIHGSRGIFQRIADVSRVLSAREQVGRPDAENRGLQVTEKTRPEPIRKSGMSAEDEQYIDIPAFLRRQAN